MNEQQKTKGQKPAEDIFWCCQSNLEVFGPSAGEAQDGETWKCPTCGELWEHVCDEAEGCHWRLKI